MQILSVLSLAALAAASPISIGDYRRALKTVKRQVSTVDVDNFDFYAEHSGAAYCNSADVEPGAKITCGGTCDEVEANGATIVGTFDGLWTGIAGYVAVDTVRKEVVFSARGSTNIRNWIANVNFGFTDLDLADGAKAHSGFNQAWGEMSSGVTDAINQALADNPGFKVVATGHSLGGAVATLGAANLRAGGLAVDLYTYGSPRAGNDVLADFITNQDGPEYRVTHIDDPVPRLPPIFTGYRHTSPEYWLSVDEAGGDDYPVADIRVCEGNANVDCNGGTFGLNIAAHLSYFGDISGCNPILGRKKLASTDGVDVSDDDLETQVNEWVQKDIDFVNSA